MVFFLLACDFLGQNSQKHVFLVVSPYSAIQKPYQMAKFHKSRYPISLLPFQNIAERLKMFLGLSLIIFTYSESGVLAQWIWSWTSNLRVGGSNPAQVGLICGLSNACGSLLRGYIELQIDLACPLRRFSGKRELAIIPSNTLTRTQT